MPREDLYELIGLCKWKSPVPDTGGNAVSEQTGGEDDMKTACWQAVQPELFIK